ncbi:MAG: hypothetical protein FJY11_01850 [Bacteroidetes bacterium]|nr:hypothetical protein [Bacteroidota bacterium]
MKVNEEEYNRFTEVMGRSHNAPAHPDLLAERIIERVLGESRKAGSRPAIHEFVFGWTTVGWARRSLSIASLLLVGLFVYQQFEIMTGIKDINYRMKAGGGIEVRPAESFEPGQALRLKSLSSSLPYGVDSIKVSVDDISRLIELYKELELSRERINRILQLNPEILRMIEKEYRGSLMEDRNKPTI